MTHTELVARLAIDNHSRIVLLVIDGVSELRTAAQPATALETATVDQVRA